MTARALPRVSVSLPGADLFGRCWTQRTINESYISSRLSSCPILVFAVFASVRARVGTQAERCALHELRVRGRDPLRQHVQPGLGLHPGGAAHVPRRPEVSWDFVGRGCATYGSQRRFQYVALTQSASAGVCSRCLAPSVVSVAAVVLYHAYVCQVYAELEMCFFFCLRWYVNRSRFFFFPLWAFFWMIFLVPRDSSTRTGLAPRGRAPQMGCLLDPPRGAA